MERSKGQADADLSLGEGDRLFVVCERGPCLSRLVNYPPPLEIDESGGTYVLNDDGTQDEWVYFWLPAEM